MARPSRKHSSRLISSLFFAFFLFIALIALCPPAVSAAEDKKAEYGAVIGIGTSFFLFLPPSLLFQSLIWFLFRLGNNVRGVHRALTLTLLTSFFFASQLFLCCVRVFVSDLWICPLTTFSPLFSVQRGGRVEIIANDQGHRITPSWVAFTDEERLYVLPFLFFQHSTSYLPRNQDR
jgi:hypothetical protein